MKPLLKRTAIGCGLFWLFYLAQVGLLSILTESWMLLAIFLMLSQRLTLWLSPFVVSGIVWVAGLVKPRSAIWKILLMNLAVLAVNFGCFGANYLLTGGWY